MHGESRAVRANYRTTHPTGSAMAKHHGGLGRAAQAPASSSGRAGAAPCCCWLPPPPQQCAGREKSRRPLCCCSAGWVQCESLAHPARSLLLAEGLEQLWGWGPRSQPRPGLAPERTDSTFQPVDSCPWKSFCCEPEMRSTDGKCPGFGFPLH